MPKRDSKASEPTQAEEVMKYTVREANVPLIYANNANIKATFWDVRIDLGLLQGAEEGKSVVAPTATVMMSWPHAKVLAAVIARVVKNYEDKFGPIQTPQELEGKKAEQPK